MIVTFHSPDGESARAASLAAIGLHAEALPPGTHRDDVTAAMDEAAETEADLVASLPLEALVDPGLRCRADLAVVVIGPDPAPAAVALSFAKADERTRPPGTPPLWLLDGRAGYDGILVRALPSAFLRTPHRTPDAAATLAACLLLAVADPFATHVRRERLIDALGGETARDIELGRRLVALAGDIDETYDPPALAPGRRTRRDRRPDARETSITLASGRLPTRSALRLGLGR